MLFDSTEMNIQLMKMLQKCSEWRSLGHLREGIDILREAFASITELTIRSRHIRVSIVDVAREEDARVDLAPVGSHLFAVFAAGIEIGDLVCAEDIVHILGQLGFQRGHHGELLAHEDFGEQLVSAGEDHRLLPEVLDEGALGQELGHIAHLVPRLP